MALKLLSKSTFSVMSPEASGPINQVVPGLLFGVVQPYQQPGSCFPANSAVSVQVPHGVTGFFEFPEDLRDHLGPGAMGALIFDVVVFDIDQNRIICDIRNFMVGSASIDFGNAVAKLAL
jgi:hypothetical protein